MNPTSKASFILLCVLLFFIPSKAQESWIRYNLAGYDAVRPKKAVVMSKIDLSGTTWRIEDSTNTTVVTGTLGASLASKGEYMPMTFNYTIDFSTVQNRGKYKLTVGHIPAVVIQIKPQPYAPLLSQILRTIRVRRSGSPDALDHAISHLGDSICIIHKRSILDGNNLGKTNSGTESWKASTGTVDMRGGYYDAGDYIKFTLTNAHLTYFMLRSYETAPELFDGVKIYSTTSLDDLLDNAKWGLDYLARCMPETTEFIIQTGGSKDHEQTLRLPENDLLNGKRECYSALSKTQMGLSAAALALGAKVFFAKGWTVQAELYKTKAIQMYSAAKASTSPTAWWQTTASGGEEYYPDRTENDNMELAAIELHLLTNEASYLTDAVSYGRAAGTAYWSSWGVYNTPAHLRVYTKNTTLLSHVRQDLEVFRSNAGLPNNVWGLPHESVWGSLYSQISVAYNVIDYKRATNNSTYNAMGYDVMDYVMGKNPWGIGFVASKEIPSSLTSSFAVIYRLQPNKFPHGEIAEGPARADDYERNKQYFNPPHNPELWHSQFNTSKFTFFEQPGDYISMETTIGGLADGLYFFTLASKFFFDQTLGLEKRNEEEKLPLSVSLSTLSNQRVLTIHSTIPSVYDLTVYDIQGRPVAYFKDQTFDKILLDNSLNIGTYLVVLRAGKTNASCKMIVQE